MADRALFVLQLIGPKTLCAVCTQSSVHCASAALHLSIRDLHVQVWVTRFVDLPCTDVVKMQVTRLVVVERELIKLCIMFS